MHSVAEAALWGHDFAVVLKRPHIVTDCLPHDLVSLFLQAFVVPLLGPGRGQGTEVSQARSHRTASTWVALAPTHFVTECTLAESDRLVRVS